MGWWQIPTGLPTTFRNIKINNRGGLDVTEDIMLNLTESAFLEKEVELIKTNMLFDIPTKPDIKALQKVIRKYLDSDNLPEALYFGNYINVAEEDDTLLVIGIRSDRSFEACKQQLDKATRKVFYKHVRIDYINLDPDAEEEIVKLNADKELAPLLIKQGVKLV